MTDQTSIPTLPELMRGIEAWMADRAAGDKIAPDLQPEVERIIDGPAVNADHLFTFLAFALGCHTVAEERRKRDDPGTALCFHYFGQIMIQDAVSLMANLTQQELYRIGETKH